MALGYIYILSNYYMKGLIKIGFTERDVDERVRELSSATGVPGKFLVEYWAYVSDPQEVETKVHRQLKGKRVRGSEFFRVPVIDAIKVVETICPFQRNRYMRPKLIQESKPKELFYCSDCGARFEQKGNCPSCGKPW